MSRGYCDCGAALPYSGKGRPRLRCDACKARRHRDEVRRYRADPRNADRVERDRARNREYMRRYFADPVNAERNREDMRRRRQAH